MTGFLAFILKLVTGGALDKVLGHLEAKANTETERLKIRATREANAQAQAAKVVTTGMQYPLFWVPWSIAAIPTALWFGWGMMDSLFNGALWDVAELPEQLKAYADIVFGNIFYTGAGMAGVQVLSGAIKRR